MLQRYLDSLMSKRRGEVIFILVLVFFPLVVYSNATLGANEKYKIEANQILTLSLSASGRSLFLIEVDSSYTSLSYNFELRNSTDHIITSNSNINSDFTSGYVGYGEYKARFINNNNEILVLKIKSETYHLETNVDINGLSYKNELFCWSFNTNEITEFAHFPIYSLKKRDYFLTFISLGSINYANIWLSYYNPPDNPDWATYIYPMNFDRNLEVGIEIDNNVNWIVIDISSTEDVDVIIFLTPRRLNVVGKFFIGLLATTVGVSLFVFIYLDPLKYRKRKVDGESYDLKKQKYEQHEDLEDTLNEVLTSEKSKD
jgi:hypothetical protein